MNDNSGAWGSPHLPYFIFMIISCHRTHLLFNALPLLWIKFNQRIKQIFSSLCQEQYPLISTQDKKICRDCLFQDGLNFRCHNCTCYVIISEFVNSLTFSHCCTAYILVNIRSVRSYYQLFYMLIRTVRDLNNQLLLKH